MSSPPKMFKKYSTFTILAIRPMPIILPFYSTLIWWKLYLLKVVITYCFPSSYHFLSLRSSSHILPSIIPVILPVCDLSLKSDTLACRLQERGQIVVFIPSASWTCEWMLWLSRLSPRGFVSIEHSNRGFKFFLRCEWSSIFCFALPCVERL
jgi:hypothetical protein